MGDACTRPWPTWPVIPEAGRAAVAAVLDSGRINYWTGSECRQFEKEFGEYVQTSYALAVANGTVALELALRSVGIGPGDEVIVPSRTFIATAGAVVAVGAVPVIADIDPDTNCLTPLSVARVATPRTRAVIVVHLGGWPAPVDELLSFTRQLGLRVIEDCAQAHGARLRGRAVGTWGDVGCYSFCQEKIMPLGEGGMIVWREDALPDELAAAAGVAADSDPDPAGACPNSDPNPDPNAPAPAPSRAEFARAAYRRAWAWRDHGRSWQRSHDAGVAAPSPRFRYLNDSFGTNARLGEMEGALGRVLLRELPAWHEARTRNAAVLFEELGGGRCPALRLPDLSADAKASGSEHAFYRLYGRIDTDALAQAQGWTRDRVIDAINTRVGAGVAQYGSSALIGKEAAFHLAGFDQGADRLPGAESADRLPGAESADRQSIAFFLHPTLTPDHLRTVAAATRQVMADALAS